MNHVSGDFSDFGKWRRIYLACGRNPFSSETAAYSVANERIFRQSAAPHQIIAFQQLQPNVPSNSISGRRESGVGSAVESHQQPPDCLSDKAGQLLLTEAALLLIEREREREQKRKIKLKCWS